MQDASLVTDNAVVDPNSFVNDTLLTNQLVTVAPQPETNIQSYPEGGGSTAEALEQLGWMKYSTAAGDPYYYNLNSGETQWTLPDEVLELEAELISSGKFRIDGGNVSTLTRRSAKSVTAVDDPIIEYDYDRARLSPSGAFQDSLNPGSASRFRASSRGPTKVSFAGAGDGAMKSSDLDISNIGSYDGLDLRILEEARKRISPVLISRIRKRFRAASYTYGGVNWDKVFGQYDTSGDGVLDADEFFLAIRAGLKIPPREVSDRDVEVLLTALDMNGDGKIDLIEFAAFLAEDDGREEEETSLRRR